MRNPPEGVESMEQLVDYILRSMDRYPRGQAALVYGMGKAEEVIQGGVGAGLRSRF